MSKRLDLAGLRFGRLLVLAKAQKVGARGRTFWRCECDCGKQAEVSGARLLAAEKPTRSCGCLRKETSAAACRSRATHNLGGTRIYNIWRKMLLRCTDSSQQCWQNYGGRGISVCDEWAESPEQFLAWANANGYSDHLTIERIDNNGNYEPSNCRWATRLEQNRNRRSNFTVTVGDKTMCATEWAQESGVGRKAIANRIRAGIAPDLAVSMPGHSLRAHFEQANTTVRERVK